METTYNFLMKLLLCITLISTLHNLTNAQTFTEVEDDGIPSYSFSDLTWGDYDNDGDLDIAIVGALDTDDDTFADLSAANIYRNENGTFSVVEGTDFYGLHLGAVELIDIDNDGDLDMITTGQNYEDIVTYPMNIYRNDGDTFALHQALPGAIYSSFDSGDYDLDGDLDILMSGVSSNGRITKILNNNGGLLAETDISLTGVQNGNAEFADFDNDGRLDVLIMGIDTDDNYILHYFHNNGTGFDLKQELDGIYLGSFAVADHDNDGDLDFAVMGDDTNDDYAAFVYTNDNGIFSQTTTLAGIDNSSGPSSIDWGDYNNDGLRDLIMAGTEVNFEDSTFLYQNTMDGFVRAEVGIRHLGGNTALEFGDYDGDNDLDLIISGSFFNDNFDYLNTVVLETNNTETVNEIPNPPTNLAATYNTSMDSITFQWDMATDDTTPAAGLSYWIQIIRMSDDALIARYPVQTNTWTLSIPADDYRWSVRAVDAADAVSNAASAEITISSTIDALNNHNIKIYPNPVEDRVFVLSDYETVHQALIYNMKGQLIGSFNLDNNSINLESVGTGLYELLLLTDQGLRRLSLIKK